MGQGRRGSWLRGWSLLILLTGGGFADEIRLKNGDRLSGSIVRGDQKVLILKTEYAGLVTISVEAIEQIVTAQSIYVSVAKGETLFGQLLAREGRYEVLGKETASPVRVEAEAIEAIRSVAEQATFERLRNPGWLDLWNGGVDFGYSLTTGNTRTNNLTLGGTLGRQTPRDKTSFYATYINAQNKTRGIAETTANAIRGGGRYESSVSSRLSGFGFADLEYNQIQLLDLRTVLGGGLGWSVIKRERGQLQLFGGGSYNREAFATGLQRSSGEVLIGQDLTAQLNERIQFRERLQLFPNLTQSGEFRHTLDATLSTKITRWMNWSITASNRYLSNPVPGARNNDLLLTTGLGINFRNLRFR
jgi:putative salt-induced outer membrane protein